MSDVIFLDLFVGSYVVGVVVLFWIDPLNKRKRKR